jgi:23S rRNA pseudouridine1911/1915/1917 synthase
MDRPHRHRWTRRGRLPDLDLGRARAPRDRASSRCRHVRSDGRCDVGARYHALVQGHPDPSSGTIDAPIGRHGSNDWKFAVRADGKASVTHYDTIEAFQAASLLDVHLETGRTHQIRVHFSALRHPCCGDLTYGADPRLAERLGLERQWLHAKSLAFAHPSDGRWIEIESKYPADLEHALAVLRGA